VSISLQANLLKYLFWQNNRVVGKMRSEMESKKEKNSGPPEMPCTQIYLQCKVCGLKIKPDACSWQEDDYGAMYCKDCRAERESCGCSD
jgi:hypothetical protein